MFLTQRFYALITCIILLLGSGYIFGSLFLLGQVALLVLLCTGVVEFYLLYRARGIQSSRHCAERFSNGDENEVSLHLTSRYPFSIRLTVVDEIPPIFQDRHLQFHCVLRPNEEQQLSYKLRPTRRGSYSFGRIRLFATTSLGLLERRFSCGEPQVVKVYPSYLMLHRYELLAMSHNLTELGIKRIRRVGHQTEFEQIKEYVQGNDYRTVNWKASAHHHQLMVNVYQDERSQQLYNVIDKGRVMQQAYQGITLLDYAINASLVLSYIVMRKDDKAGLITFNDHFGSFIPASKQSGQMQALLENLYQQESTFGETDFSALCVHLGKHVNKRSLLVLYTNFDSISSLNRQLPYLYQLTRQHRLLVVFFEDTDIKEYLTQPAVNTEEYYHHVIAEKFLFEKRLIVSTLQQHGIYSVLTTPDKLTIDVINKYLEIKSRQIL